MSSTDTTFAALRLKLFCVWEEDKNGDWDKNRDSFYKAWSQYQQGVQRAMGDILVHLRNIRVNGKTRFATATERKKKRLPVACYSKKDLNFESVFYNAIKTCGVAARIYADSTHAICHSEFTGNKMRDLLHGNNGLPSLRRTPMYIGSSHYRIGFEERQYERKNKDGDMVTVTSQVPVLYVKNLFAGQREIAFEAWNIRGRGSDSKQRILEALVNDDKNWTYGALSIRRVTKPGKGVEWYLQIPYQSPKALAKPKKCVVILHRSIAAALHALVITSNGISHYDYVGHRIVMKKSQFYARRRRIAKDSYSTKWNGRGRRYRSRAMTKLGNAEADYTKTELWRMARWAQDLVEEHKPQTVLVESFNSFFNGDLNMPPYIRRWPYAELKLKIIDALTRRATVKTKIEEVSQHYISRRCPLCDHESLDNVQRLPRTSGNLDKNGMYLYSPGHFKCIECGLTLDLEALASSNMALATKLAKTVSEENTGVTALPVWARKVLLAKIKRMMKHKAATKVSKAVADRFDVLSQVKAA